MTSAAPTHEWPPAGALTTVFTPLGSYCATGTARYRTFDCMPPSFSEYWLSKTNSNYIGYYSPGICPSGWTSACGRPVYSTVSYGPPLLPSETAIVCCPSKYSCDTDYLSWCSSPLSTPIYSTVTYTYTSSASTETETYTYSATALTETVTRTYSASLSLETDIYTTTSLAAYGIQVRWQSSDFSVLETHPLSPGVLLAGVVTTPSSSSSTPIRTTTATPTPTPTPTASDSGGLSQGAKIGIGVGVSLGVLAIILATLALCLFRRRRRNRLEQGDSRNTEIVLTTSPMTSVKPPTYSDVSTHPVKPSVDLETERLREEQARLQERRDRLRQLDMIDEEEDRLRRQIAHNEAQKYRPYSLGAHEMRG